MNRVYSPIPCDQIYGRKVIDLKLICTNTELKSCPGSLENWNPKFLHFSVFFREVFRAFYYFSLLINPLYDWFSHLLKGFVDFFLFADTSISMLITCWGHKPWLSPSLWFCFSFPPLLFYKDRKVDTEEISSRTSPGANSNEIEKNLVVKRK